MKLLPSVTRIAGASNSLAMACCIHLLVLFVVLSTTFTEGNAKDSYTGNGKIPGSHGEGDKPRIILHIGPHKTATTSIQKAIFEMENENWKPVSFGYGRKRNKEIGASGFQKNIAHAFALPMRYQCHEETFLAPFREYFSQMAIQHQNLILSSEELAPVYECGVSDIASMLEGFHVTIVIAYRMWLPHVVSMFSQRSKVESLTSRTITFADYIMNNVDSLVYPPPMAQTTAVTEENRRSALADVHNYDGLIQKYQNAFSNQSSNIVIMDYYGILSSTKSILHVFICEVVDVPCKEDSYEDSYGKNKSSKERTRMMQIQRYFAEYKDSRGCDSEFLNAPEAVLTYEDMEKLERLPFPERDVPRLGLFEHYSVLVDDNLRKKYGDMIMYGNVTANREAAAHVSMTFPDDRALLLSVQWRNAFEEILRRNKKALSSCSLIKLED